MENAMKIVLLAVTVIIVAVLIVAAFSLVNSGQGLLSTGKSQVNESVKNYGEAAYTQYDAAIVAGSQVISAIKTDWKKDNTVCIIVCTKDGSDICYDYSYSNYNTFTSSSDEDGKTMRDNFPQDCKGKTLDCTNSTTTKIPDIVSAGNGDSSTNKKLSLPTADGTNGYKEGAKTSTSGYISRNANFKGSIQRDQNGNIRCVTFVQQ
jgi:type II secretory pathway pseudopilin PulG